MTAEGTRSACYGKRMLDWLVGVTREEGCGFLQLDSGITKHEVHRFYLRDKMGIFAYRFAKAV